MRKLLAATFPPLERENILVCLSDYDQQAAVCYNWIGYNEINEPQVHVEDMIFCMLSHEWLCCLLLFISMRLGTEFEEHTIRNKFIVGYSRTQVYFAEYITCMVASRDSDGNHVAGFNSFWTFPFP